MIDCANETVIFLSEVPGRLPRRRDGKKISLQTVYRWSLSGCKHTVLESVQIGGRRATSLEALNRFFERLSHKHDNGDAASPRRTPIQRQRQSEAAADALKKLGV
jgi:hypothetical protein